MSKEKKSNLTEEELDSIAGGVDVDAGGVHIKDGPAGTTGQSVTIGGDISGGKNPDTPFKMNIPK